MSGSHKFGEYEGITTENDLTQRIDASWKEDLELAVHLLRASVMACESIEDMADRNAMVALIAQVEEKVRSASVKLGKSFSKG